MEQNPQVVIENALGKEASVLFDRLFKQKPYEANAIIFLQGDRFDRAPKVVALYRENFARYILITGNNDLVGRGKRNEENDVHLLKLKEYLVRHGIPQESIFIDDASMNTLDQARNTVRIAKEHRWETILVVTSPYHLLRAFLTFVKEAHVQDWQGTIVMQSVHLPWERVPSGRKKTALEMLEVEVGKIQRYSKNLATLREGLHYLEQFSA